MAWPSDLPPPLIANYGFTESLPILRTQMEQGPDRVARISSAYVTQLNVAVMLTADQLEDFRDFLEGEANMGADWFDMPIVTTNSVENHSVRITSVSTQHFGTRYQVSMTLETEEHIA